MAESPEREFGRVSDAVADGREAALVALRDEIAGSIDAAEPQFVASLAKQLRDTLAELESLTPPEVSAVDDLAKKRTVRRGEATVRERAPVGEQRGAGDH